MSNGTQDLDELIPQAAPLAEPWGKLVSLNKAKVPSTDLSVMEITIGRNDTNGIVIADSRLSGVHCKLTFKADACEAMLMDLSTNGTFLGDSRVGKNNQVIIKSGDEIYLLHKSKVAQSDTIGFAYFQNKLKQAVALPNENDGKMKKMDELSEDFHCPICDDLIFQAVTLMPCLHNFCGSCFSDWMAKQKTCPTCRKDVDCVNRNPTINNVVEKFLDIHPEKKRPADEYKEMDERNKIKTDMLTFKNGGTNGHTAPPPPPATLVIAPLPARGRGRGRGTVITTTRQVAGRPVQQEVSDYSASSDDERPTRECITCKKEVQGFSCKKRGQLHAQCTNCGSRMPKLQLNESQLPHCCGICTLPYCTLYNKGCAKLNTRVLNYRLRDAPVPNTVNIQCFRQNHIEAKYFQDYMTNNGITTRMIFQHMLDNYITTGQFRYIQDKRTHLNVVRNIDMVLKDDFPVCGNCFVEVWQQIVFRYRILNKDKMANDVKSRVNCYYGINCKTMVHNQDHAKKLDHVCEQTKF